MVFDRRRSQTCLIILPNYNRRGRYYNAPVYHGTYLPITGEKIIVIITIILNFFSVFFFYHRSESAVYIPRIGGTRVINITGSCHENRVVCTAVWVGTTTGLTSANEYHDQTGSSTATIAPLLQLYSTLFRGRRQQYTYRNTFLDRNIIT